MVINGAELRASLQQVQRFGVQVTWGAETVPPPEHRLSHNFVARRLLSHRRQAGSAYGTSAGFSLPSTNRHLYAKDVKAIILPISAAEW
ncbi:hypothetical protein VTH82DRAFT_1985 [Thermothelomyces myriococcoides]